jgi:lipoprotein-anchoring transpeptidase ErfK/SrfK
MNRILLSAAALASALAFSGPSRSEALVARIDVPAQTMQVIRYGKVLYTWRVSTARRGYITPAGSWRPKRLHKMWYSRKYDNAPMPHSIFFHGGYAVHATPHIKRLGRPASHGCIRLHPDNAADLYQLVQTFGPGNTSIVIVK